MDQINSGEKKSRNRRNLGVDVANRRRFYIATTVMYLAFVVLVGATIVAYPGIFSDPEAIRYAIRENYQVIVAVVSALAAIITAAIVSPKRLGAVAEGVFPAKVIASGAVEIASLFANKFSGRDDEGVSTEIGANSAVSVPNAAQASEKDDLGVDELFRGFLRRMEREQSRLRQNALANLLWGVAFSIIGLAVLGYPVFFPSETVSGEWSVFAIGYVPRGALGLLIALISFFFLRLYATNEYDLKHNKNEITTFESKMIAVKMIDVSKMTEGHDAAMGFVVGALAENERNFVLKRDEKTISAEVDRTYNDVREMVRDVLQAVKSDQTKS